LPLLADFLCWIMQLGTFNVSNSNAIRVANILQCVQQQFEAVVKAWSMGHVSGGLFWKSQHVALCVPLTMMFWAREVEQDGNFDLFRKKQWQNTCWLDVHTVGVVHMDLTSQCQTGAIEFHQSCMLWLSNWSIWSTNWISKKGDGRTIVGPVVQWQAFGVQQCCDFCFVGDGNAAVCNAKRDVITHCSLEWLHHVKLCSCENTCRSSRCSRCSDVAHLFQKLSTTCSHPVVALVGRLFVLDHATWHFQCEQQQCHSSGKHLAMRPTTIWGSCQGLEHGSRKWGIVLKESACCLVCSTHNDVLGKGSRTGW